MARWVSAPRSGHRGFGRVAGKLNVLKRLIPESSFLAHDISSFRRQESTFVILNLFVLAVLLLIHTLFSSIFGAPPLLLIVVLEHFLIQK